MGEVLEWLAVMAQLAKDSPWVISQGELASSCSIHSRIGHQSLISSSSRRPDAVVGFFCFFINRTVPTQGGPHISENLLMIVPSRTELIGKGDCCVHEPFQAMLPKIRRQASINLRHLGAQAREEFIAEVIALATALGTA